MSNLYIARDWETGELITFMDFSELQDFSREHEYAYEYFKVPIAREYSAWELFLKNSDDD